MIDWESAAEAHAECMCAWQSNDQWCYRYWLDANIPQVNAIRNNNKACNVLA